MLDDGVQVELGVHADVDEDHVDVGVHVVLGSSHVLVVVLASLEPPTDHLRGHR